MFEEYSHTKDIKVIAIDSLEYLKAETERVKSLFSLAESLIDDDISPEDEERLTDLIRYHRIKITADIMAAYKDLTELNRFGTIYASVPEDATIPIETYFRLAPDKAMEWLREPKEEDLC